MVNEPKGIEEEKYYNWPGAEEEEEEDDFVQVDVSSVPQWPSPVDIFILCIESLMFVLEEGRKRKVNSLRVDLEEWVDVDVFFVLHMQSKDQNTRRSNTNIVDPATESFHIDYTTRIAIRIDQQADERVSRLRTNVAKLWDHVDRDSLDHDASKTHHRSKEQTTTEFLNQRNYSTHVKQKLGIFIY